jgi:GTPase involved in cell partitioning and DNA repair
MEINKMDIKNNIELENLAQQLHRPVMSLKDFSLVSQQDLAWLNQQLKQTIEQENKKINQSLFKVPFFLRPLFKNYQQ